MELEDLLAGMPEETRQKVKAGALTTSLESNAFDELKVKWENETAGALEGDDCPICRNKGYVVKLQGKYIVSIECRCMAKRRSLRRMKRSGLGDLLNRYTFGTYQTPEKWQEGVKRAAFDYLNDPDGKWFAASGCAGSGKTHICTAICRELISDGVEVRYMRWKDDGGRIKAAITDNEEYARLIEPLKRVHALYIDDFWKAGNGGVTKGDIDLAFEILNARYNDSRMITIISTEIPLSKMLEIDEAVGSRIYERSKESAVEIVGRKNWRLKC